jgi:hypothetical protein
MSFATVRVEPSRYPERCVNWNAECRKVRYQEQRQ